MFSFALIGSTIIGAPGILWFFGHETTAQIGVSESGRTQITKIDTEPLYIVNGGSAADFKRLSAGAQPIVLTENRTFTVYSKFVGGAKASVSFLQYDQDKMRIGASTVKSNQRAVVTLSSNCAYLLPAIRVVGKGRLVVEEFQLAPTPGKESPTPGVSYEGTEPLFSSGVFPGSVTVAGLQTAVTNAAMQLKKIGSAFEAIDLSNLSSGDSQLGHSNARQDGEISESREKFVRELLTSMAGDLPDSNGSHHYSPGNATLGIVTDEYMFNYYKDGFENVVYLSPTNYKEMLEKYDFDAFLYVTCWKGMENDEWKGVKYRETPATALAEILEYARQNALPTIFQTIEDPSNFEYFLPVAEKFDYIFTSDTDMVDEYKEKLGHDRVYYGEYGANPLVNNPIGTFRHDLPKAFFAGSYPERYPERCADMQVMFDSIPSTKDNLVIVDRNFYSAEYQFPYRFQSSIIGTFSHAVLQKIHKLFRYSLNFNSIKTSPTMCAMRVYELQAQGKTLLSNYAQSVFNEFPEIRIVPFETKLVEIGKPEVDHFERYMAQRSLNNVMWDKNGYAQIGVMARTVGLNAPQTRNESIVVVAVGDVEAVRKFVEEQNAVHATVVSDLSEVNLEDYGYIAAMDGSQIYSRDYLASRLNAFKYTDSRFVTQFGGFDADGNYTTEKQHEYCLEAVSRQLTMVSTEHPDAVGFMSGEIDRIEGAGYATDHYQVNYLPYRPKASSDANEQSARTPLVSVIIPVYNNARFLETKCLPSLRRDECFDRMEILLVDDGSTDPLTLKTCKWLAAQNPNIKYFSFEDGGSGSASRPRNKGVELATAEFIAFLDPDNEISPNGYGTLYKELMNTDPEADFISGFQVKVSKDFKITGQHASGSTVFDNPGEYFFSRGRFPVVSTQAALIRRDFLLRSEIDFVERAAGQDTLYGWELIGKSQKAVFTDRTYLIYYAERSDSVTNEVSSRYFEKHLILEKEQAKRLQTMGWLETFKDTHLKNFVRDWYLPRLEAVPSDERAHAEKLLDEIVQAYGFENKDCFKEA